MGENGKGDKPRPLSVPIATYKENYNRIFRKTQQEEPEIPFDLKLELLFREEQELFV